MLKSVRFRTAAALVLTTSVAAGIVFVVTDSAFVEILVAALTAGTLGVLVVTMIMRPLGHMAHVARRIAAGDLGARVVQRPPGEFGELADAFNQMASSLEALVESGSQERNRLMAALNSSIDAVTALDRDGRIRFANLAAERLFGRDQSSLLGSAFGWVMPQPEVVEALKASREGSRRETRLIERPGRQHFQVICTPIVGGGEWDALVVFHDISDVKRVDQVRRDFVANVSHELRTPLASVKAVLETLESGALDDREAALDFLQRADAEVDRLVQLVEELLELSRIESGAVPLDRAEVDLGTVIRQAVERMRPQAERKGISLDLSLEDALPPVMGDAERLERALLNLLHNAIKFTPTGGEVRVSAAAEAGLVQARVRDTGVGISSRDLPRIFERFYKVERARGQGGTGLGLAVVKHTLEAHGGSVAVESQQGRGSTFILTLPAAGLANG